MDIIPHNEVIEQKDIKKRYLIIDKICIQCGTIINSYYLTDCVICEGPLSEDSETKCKHKEFIDGNTSRNIRIFLDFHIEDLKALCEIHGCHIGTRKKMVLQILKKINPDLDKRVDERLLEKVIIRNRRKFWYVKEIESIIKTKKSVERQNEIKLLDATEII